MLTHYFSHLGLMKYFPVCTEAQMEREWWQTYGQPVLAHKTVCHRTRLCSQKNALDWKMGPQIQCSFSRWKKKRPVPARELEI